MIIKFTLTCFELLAIVIIPGKVDYDNPIRLNNRLERLASIDCFFMGNSMGISGVLKSDGYIKYRVDICCGFIEIS